MESDLNSYSQKVSLGRSVESLKWIWESGFWAKNQIKNCHKVTEKLREYIGK